MAEPRRVWLPADWLDEVNTSLLDSPEAFIEREGDGWALRLPQGDFERDNPFYRLPVELGQIVPFHWSERYEDRVLTIFQNRSWTTDYSLPEGAKQFYCYANGAIVDSMQELVDVDDVDDALAPGDYEIQCYTWSEPIPYRFDVDADGTARFLLCAGVH